MVSFGTLGDCVPWKDTHGCALSSAERRGLPGGAVLGDRLMGRVDTEQVIGEWKWPEDRTEISALKPSLRGTLKWPLGKTNHVPWKVPCRTPHRVTLPCPPFAVEQVANVVLYSSDYYIKPVAMDETQ